MAEFYRLFGVLAALAIAVVLPAFTPFERGALAQSEASGVGDSVSDDMAGVKASMPSMPRTREPEPDRNVLNLRLEHEPPDGPLKGLQVQFITRMEGCWGRICRAMTRRSSARSSIIRCRSCERKFCFSARAYPATIGAEEQRMAGPT